MSRRGPRAAVAVSTLDAAYGLRLANAAWNNGRTGLCDRGRNTGPGWRDRFVAGLAKEFYPVLPTLGVQPEAVDKDDRCAGDPHASFLPIADERFSCLLARSSSCDGLRA